MAADHLPERDPLNLPQLPYARRRLQSRVRFENWVLVLCWLSPATPHLLIYLCWLIAFVTLGHPPRPVLDDPKRVGLVLPFVYVVSALWVFYWPIWASAAIVLSYRIQRRRDDEVAELSGTGNRTGWVPRVVPLAVAFLFSYLVLVYDPLGVLEWFLD